MIAAIGDVHGEIEKLEGLLGALPQVDRIVFLGDYVDRGPDVRRTIDRLIALQQDRPETVFIRGNHDQMMLDVRAHFLDHRDNFLTADDVAAWLSWGGMDTIRSYRDGGASAWHQRVPREHWQFLESTVLEHREGGFIFVHAGVVPPGKTYQGHVRWQDDPRLWIRDVFLNSQADMGGRVVFGHSVQSKGPLVQPNKVGVDTGACFGGPLTAAILDQETADVVDFVQFG